MKRILRVSIFIILILVSSIIYISYITTHNEEELAKLTNDISSHYNTREEITYSNQYGNYYIIKTKTKAIVISKEYKEIMKEDISKLKNNFEDAELIYKTNKLMYEKTIRNNKKVTYEYYDAISGEKIKSTILEQQ